jgi:hypothetical protein
MTAYSILKKAVDLGVKLVAVDGRIKGRGAKPDPAFMAKLRAHEGEIVALLSAKSEPDPVEPEDTKAAALGGEPGF